MSKIKSNKKVDIRFEDDGNLIVDGLDIGRVCLSFDEYIHTSNDYLFWFDEGNIDEWCVYCIKPNKKTWFAYDWEYLSWIRKMGRFHGEKKVYDSFIKIFDSVNFNFDMDLGYKTIQDVAKDYKANTEHYWTWFWMTMVAEERKENAILGKRIKRLGVYNMLFDTDDNGKPFKLSYVVKYMRGMRWYDLDELCRERGF